MTDREGFSLIELMVALVLLTVALVGIQSATSRYLRTVVSSDRTALAAEVAKDRIELIRADPAYATLAARYAESGTPVFDPPEFTRDTRIVMLQDSTDQGVIEYVRVTVSVDGPGLPRPVARTISLARP